jgi:type IV fimbrial biogenesis protein FimT
MFKVNGFTLVGLLVSLIIIGILTSLAAPRFGNIFADNKLAVQHNRLITAISLTRSEAIKRGQRVTLCQSTDNTSCTKDSVSWHKGWVAYVDSDANNQIDSDEPILLIQQQTTANIGISFGARTRIVFHPNGQAVGGSNGTLLLCDHRGDAAKQGLIISITGRVRKAQTSDLNSKACPP